MVTKTLNLKEYMPTVEQALKMIDIEIELSKKEGIKALKVIHGYGSSGVGGEINKALQNWAKLAKRKKLIKDYIRGTEWIADSEKVLEAKRYCPNLVGDPELFFYNPGISII